MKRSKVLSEEQGERMRQFFKVIEAYRKGSNKITCPECGAELQIYEDFHRIMVDCPTKGCIFHGHLTKLPEK